MRQIRTAFCIFSVVAALFAFVQHLGFNLWNCASCSSVNQIPISGAIAWFGPIILGVLTFGLYKDTKWAKIGLGIAACCSVALIAWMITHNTICLFCMLVHIGVISATLSLLPQPKFLGLLFFSTSVAFTATGGWNQLTVTSNMGIFQSRDNEQIPDGKVYVLFTDPECSRCQMLEAEIAKLPQPPKIVYRWNLLPQNMYRSIRAVTLLEMARAHNPSNFEKLRLELLKASPPLNDDVLMNAASKVGLGALAKGWLDHPSDRVLIAIEGDQATAAALKIQSLPALAELSDADASGLRTLKTVPFSTLGLAP
jgi:hypothetical protein